MLSIVIKYVRSSAVITAVFGVLFLATSPASSAHAEGAYSQSETVAATILDQMNRDRGAAGLPALVESEFVSAVAEDRAVRMASSRWLTHVDPWGASSATLLTSAGVSYSALGENIARTNYGVEYVAPLVEQAWMQSDDHRANILDSRFERVGIGIAYDGSMIYVSTIFLR